MNGSPVGPQYNGKMYNAMVNGKLAVDYDSMMGGGAGPGGPAARPPAPVCPMTERARDDGSCEGCKDPYVQSADGMDCEYVGERQYGEDIYYGRLRNYKQYGKGFYQWGKTGSQYYGTWYNGQKHGMGIKIFKSGAKYLGEWQNDRMSGRGVYTYKSGRTYDGEFRRDQYNGEGTLTWPDGTMIRGRFRNDEIDGYGEKIWADGSRYEGNWRQGWEDGEGVRYYKNGDTYKGGWEKGKRSGYGTQTKADGSIRWQGKFSKGIFRG